MAETEKHLDIPFQNPTGTEQASEQKIEELEKHSDDKIIKTTKEISELKNEIETKVLAKTEEFLDENPCFEMEIKNKIHDLRNAPVNEPEKTIYENTLFFLETGFRKLLILNLKAAEETDFQKIAEESTKEWIASLEEMANGRYIEYHELLPRENEVYAPEVKKLLEDSQFLREAGELAEAADKKEFVSFYLEKWAAAAGEPNTESATRFLNEARTMLLQSVGGGHLSQEEFREIWEEVSNNPAAAELLKAAENTKGEVLENFNEWLAKEEAEIKKEFAKKEDRRKRIQSESNSNPYGFSLRKWGSLGSAFMYFGKDILGGIILVNLALAKFNPVKLLSNPVAWVTVGGIAAIVNHSNPLFPTTPDVKKAVKENLKNKIENLREYHPNVREWLMKFRKSDLARNGEIGKLLAEKGRTSITSKEIGEFLDEDDRPTVEILEKSTEADLLFQFFKACQNENIDPKNLENV